MLRNKLRCEQRARAHIARGVLSLAVAAGAASPVWAQNETGPTAGAPNAANPAPSPATNGGEAPSLLLPAGRPFGFTHDEYVDLSETYETYPLGIQNHSDEFTALSLGIGLHDHTPRLTGDLQYTFTGYAYARNRGYDQLTNFLNALVTATLVPEHVLLNASAFATPILINQFGAISAPGAPAARGINTGSRDTYGYQVSPELVFRLANFARSEAIVTDSAVYFTNPYGPAISPIAPVGLPPTQFIAYSATERLVSGPDFARLGWQLSGAGAWIYESGINFRQYSGTADFEYAINHEFSVLATGGYAAFTSNQIFIRNLDGPIVFGGIRYTMFPRLSASFRAGQQFNRPSYLSDINYQITPFTTFNFSLTDNITTPAGGLLGNLGQIGVNNLGNFYNINYGLGPNLPPGTVTPVSGFNPIPIGGAAITDVISRYRQATGSLVHIAGRTQYRLTGYWTDYVAVVQTANLAQQELTGAEFSITRNINPFLTGSVSADYTNQHVFGGDLGTVFGTVALNYNLSQLMSVYFRASYIRRLTNSVLVAASPTTTNFSDTAITIGIHRAF